MPVSAHELIDRLPETQRSALVGLLEGIVDPWPPLRQAPMDDQSETEEEKHSASQARDWLKRNGGKGIPHEEAMRRARPGVKRSSGRGRSWKTWRCGGRSQ